MADAFLFRLLGAGVDVRFCDLPQIKGLRASSCWSKWSSWRSSEPAWCGPH